ncbi:amino acid ABC transporter permease [Nocardioides pakistanensis]
MSTVLFDTPGPRAAARHRLYTWLGAIILTAVLGLVLWKLYVEGEFEAELWEDMAQENIWRAIWQGFQATLSAAAVAIVTSVVFGAVFAVARLSDHAWVRWPAVVIVEFFRAVPLILLILFLFIAYADVLDRFWALVAALTLYNGSVLAEVFRAGINAVPKGQSEASYGIGMRKNQVMRLVLLPQAVTIMLPAIISQCVIVLKDTSLGLIISYQDAVAQGRLIAEFVDHSVVPLGLIAVIFIAINYSLSRLAVYVERRFAQRGHSSAGKLSAAHDPNLNPGGGGAG